MCRFRLDTDNILDIYNQNINFLFNFLIIYFTFLFKKLLVFDGFPLILLYLLDLSGYGNFLNLSINLLGGFSLKFRVYQSDFLRWFVNLFVTVVNTFQRSSFVYSVLVKSWERCSGHNGTMVLACLPCPLLLMSRYKGYLNLRFKEVVLWSFDLRRSIFFLLCGIGSPYIRSKRSYPVEVF